MARFRWRTNAAGVVLVSDQGGPLRAPTLGPRMANVMDQVIANWAPLAEAHEKRTGVLQSWQLAFVFRESGGIASARNTADIPPGLGLFQITSLGLYRGMTQMEVLVPTTNWRIGVDFMATIKGRQHEPDLPSVASVFNAGGIGPYWAPHPEMDENLYPWGYHETRGHISAEVAANNYELAKRLGPDVLEQPVALDDMTVLQAMGVVSASLWQLVGDVLDENRADYEAERRRRLDDMFGLVSPRDMPTSPGRKLC